MRFRAFWCGNAVAALFVVTLTALAEDMVRIDGSQYPIESERGLADACPAQNPIVTFLLSCTNVDFCFGWLISKYKFECYGVSFHQVRYQFAKLFVQE